MAEWSFGVLELNCEFEVAWLEYIALILSIPVFFVRVFSKPSSSSDSSLFKSSYCIQGFFPIRVKLFHAYLVPNSMQIRNFNLQQRQANTAATHTHVHSTIVQNFKKSGRALFSSGSCVKCETVVIMLCVEVVRCIIKVI